MGILEGIAQPNLRTVIMEFCKRLSDRRLAEMAIVGAAMRKLLHTAFGVLKNNEPFDPDYGNQFIFSP